MSKKKASKDKGDCAPAEKSESEAPDAAAEQAHLESLISTGEAAKPDASGKLPAGATHELVESTEGEIKAVRRRFSAY